MENVKRSIIKSLSWRFTATITSIILILIFTKDLLLALSFGIAETIFKLIIYYYHERIWNKIKWGQK